MWVAGKNSQPRVVWTTGPGPCLMLFCLAEQTAVDRKRGAEDGGDRSGARVALLRGRLGGLDAGGTQGALFLFCFVLSEWGQLLGSGGLSTLRLYRTPPPSLKSFATLPQNCCQSSTNTHPCVSSAGGWRHFVNAPQERADVQPGREDFYHVGCQAEATKEPLYCH